MTRPLFRPRLRGIICMIRQEGFAFWWRWFGPTREARKLKRDVSGSK